MSKVKKDMGYVNRFTDTVPGRTALAGWAASSALGLALGRIGNFINGELVGRITTIPWAVKFPTYEGFRHPVQLYNSLALLSIFGFLWIIKNKKLKQGTLLFLFLLLYSLQRFLLGFVKAADQYGFILGLTIEQLIFITTAIISVIFLLKLNKK